MTCPSTQANDGDDFIIARFVILAPFLRMVFGKKNFDFYLLKNLIK